MSSAMRLLQSYNDCLVNAQQTPPLGTKDNADDLDAIHGAVFWWPVRLILHEAISNERSS